MARRSNTEALKVFLNAKPVGRLTRAAITEPWSNGQTEGQITRLKLVKRQMYSRAKLDLLRARVIGLDK